MCLSRQTADGRRSIRRLSVEDAIRSTTINGMADEFSVDPVFNRLVQSSRKATVN